MLRVRYVVLYVTDAEVCRRFWVEQVGMVEKDRKEFGGFSIVQVGFADQPFAFELVPLALMADNPDGLDLATPPSPCRQTISRQRGHNCSSVASPRWRSASTAVSEASRSATRRVAGLPSPAEDDGGSDPSACGWLG